jgi:hypothetical protein
MWRERNRASIISTLTLIALLFGILLLMGDNNQKYSAALNRAGTAIVRTNNAVSSWVAGTQVATERALQTGLPMTQTRAVQPTPSPSVTPPYDPTLYAQRQQETFLLMTVGGPTEYAIFYATETALIATYQGTPAP